MKRVASLVALLLVAAPSAAAQEPEAAPAPPAPRAQASDTAWLGLSLRAGLIDGGRTYVGRGQGLALDGDVRSFMPGQVVAVEFSRGNSTVARKVVPIRRARGGRGKFAVRLKAARTGRYTIRAVHRETRTQRWFAGRMSVRSISPKSSFGASGVNVRLLQRGLRYHGYVAPLNGRFDSATARAVLAFRKVNGMERNSRASGPVYAALLRKSGGYRLRYPGAGKHVEFDWSRQVLVLARGGRAERIYHTSSGKASTPTVFGTFRFYRKDPGTNSLGMVYSSYFIRGYAIHGFKSVPIYPASHGCLRVPIPNAVSIYNWIDHGDTIFAYR